MRDKSLSDDSLKLVKYRILFAKRGYEAVLSAASSLVHDNLTPEAFVAWKVSELARNLPRVPVPAAWGGTSGERPRYPRDPLPEKVGGKTLWFINRLDDDDNKYLRVSFEVIDRSARERFEYEEDQVKVLREIRDKLPCPPSVPSTPTGVAPPPPGPAGGAGEAWIVE